MFGSTFPQPTFKSVGPIGDPVFGDCIQQAIVEELAKGRVVLTLEGNHGLKGFECLERSLETDRSWFDAVLRSGLGHDRADEIVGQNVRPNFLPNQFRRFAAQDIHLQRLFQRLQIEFRLPAICLRRQKVYLALAAAHSLRLGPEEFLIRLLLLSDVRCRQLCGNWLITPCALVFA